MKIRKKIDGILFNPASSVQFWVKCACEFGLRVVYKYFELAFSAGKSRFGKAKQHEKKKGKIEENFSTKVCVRFKEGKVCVYIWRNIWRSDWEESATSKAREESVGSNLLTIRPTSSVAGNGVAIWRGVFCQTHLESSKCPGTKIKIHKQEVPGSSPNQLWY